ncbi:Activator of stress proteins 1 [Fusarium austroafricanum]|uniref:Activator of stress proteins 1 n=1 Tax=Fusarium austroafricanum TaxID=2364996 RepID=A0A8H4NQY4_9HYPO|nr:Activator of stress proteins 1 [Fusarium austroafricanum]
MATSGFLPSRRNLPRASHACQRCRAKKEKCDQQQPCANCVKHEWHCVYGLRRKNARASNVSVVSYAQLSARSPLSSARTHRDEAVQPSPFEQAHSSGRLDDEDVVGDINQHTHGTEFYGTSSNFVLLNQFFAYAQKNLSPTHPSFSNDVGCLSADAPGSNVSRQGLVIRSPISIVNLFSDKEVLEPPSRPKTPPLAGGRQEDIQGHPSLEARDTTEGLNEFTHGPSAVTQNKPSTDDPLPAAKQRLEREYVRQFFNNIHHLHPMLDPVPFTARCEALIWISFSSPETNKSQRHFFALYNIVIAVGAIVAGSCITQDLERDIITVYMKQTGQSQEFNPSQLSQELSKIYFRKSRMLLGDIFEVCSLESTQTLFLMSLYCQNSLKPHACYMYCGHAVRTALAIGIARECLSNSVEDRKAARRTWWCIYSHEIDMSCSAGRRDSLGKPRNYQIDLPHIKDQNINASNQPDLEKCSVTIINEMGLTLLQKSAVAKELDSLLDDWKARLPNYLDFAILSFREQEWEAKQKLVLYLRYLNAKIILHRLFLREPMRRAKINISTHAELCLDAARKTIHVIYDAYANRHYFRTWWYNSTYTLYAGMIVLYIIMLGPTVIPEEELLADAVKAYNILQSMVEATVARRSASLIQEGLEVARACIQRRQNRPDRNTEQPGHDESQGDFSNIADQFTNAASRQDHSLLASIIDPNLLQDFMVADQDALVLGFEMPSPDNLYGKALDVDAMSRMP